MHRLYTRWPGMSTYASQSSNVRIYHTSARSTLNISRIRERQARRAASAVSSPVNTHSAGVSAQPLNPVDGFLEAPPAQQNGWGDSNGPRSASHPPEYPQARAEERTGVEIATKALGRNNKIGQAPFYTGLYSFCMACLSRLTIFKQVIRQGLVVSLIYAHLRVSPSSGTFYSHPRPQHIYRMRIRSICSTKVFSICRKKVLAMSFYGHTFTMSTPLRQWWTLPRYRIYIQLVKIKSIICC